MRKAIVLLVAFGLGSLTVVGQDSGEDRELRQRIDDLSRLLQRRAAARADAVQGEVVEQRTYDVSDLTAWIEDQKLQPTILCPSKYQPPEPEEADEAGGRFQIDWMMDVLRSTVQPRSWEVIDGVDISASNGRLVIRNLPSVHAEIERRFAQFRTYLVPHVAVEVVAVRSDPDLARRFAGTTRDLSPASARALLGGERLATLSVVCIDGQQVVRREGALRRYLKDYDVEIAQSAQIGDPVPFDVFDGASVEVKATLDRNRRGVRLDLRLERTKLHDPIRRLATEHGPVELPAMDLDRFHASCWAPLGQPVLLGGGALGDDTCLWIATAHRLD